MMKKQSNPAPPNCRPDAPPAPPKLIPVADKLLDIAVQAAYPYTRPGDIRYGQIRAALEAYETAKSSAHSAPHGKMKSDVPPVWTSRQPNEEALKTPGDPWPEFLDARARCIHKLHRLGYGDKQIAKDLSFSSDGAERVRKIRELTNEIEGGER